MSNPFTDAPQYECRCVKCNLSFYAESKRALICRRCKPVGMTTLGKYEDETGFDPADHPDAGGPAGR